MQKSHGSSLLTCSKDNKEANVVQQGKREGEGRRWDQGGSEEPDHEKPFKIVERTFILL